MRKGWALHIVVACSNPKVQVTCEAVEKGE